MQTEQTEDDPVTFMDSAALECLVPLISIRKQIKGPDTRVFPSGSDVPFEIGGWDHIRGP